MTRLSLGEEHVCARCKKVIPPAEIGAIEEGHWFCSVCWNLWKILKEQTIAETLLTFLESKSAQAKPAGELHAAAGVQRPHDEGAHGSAATEEESA